MATLYSGRGAVVGIGAESTWGTAVSRSNWLPLISTSMQRSLTKVPRPTLRVGTLGAMRRTHFTSETVVGGDIVVEASHQSMGILLKGILGGAASTGSGPYVHTYKVGALVAGHTIEINRGTGTSERFDGCRFESATFDVSAGGVMTLSCSLIGKTGTARTTLASPTVSTTDLPILHSQCGTLAWGGNTFTLSSMSVTISNALARRQLLGATVTAQPLINDFQSVEMSVTLEVDDQLITDQLNDTEGDAVITFSSGAASTAFTVQNAYLSTVTDPVSAAGVISQSATLVGQSDGTDEGLKVVVTNASSSATAN